VCEDCGRVYDENQIVEGKNGSTQQSDFETDGEQLGSTDWTKSVEITDSTDEQLIDLLSYVDEIGDDLDAKANQRDQTAELVSNAWKKRLLVGRNRDVAVGACWYIVFREQGEPRPIDVIADAVNVSSNAIHSFRQTATTDLDISLSVAQPSEYLPYLRTQLQLTSKTSGVAKEFLEEACVSGNPAGIAAGGIYLAAQDMNQPVTMREAAQAVHLSKETIWQRVDDLRGQ